jgi:hypothetical protein
MRNLCQFLRVCFPSIRLSTTIDTEQEKIARMVRGANSAAVPGFCAHFLGFTSPAQKLINLAVVSQVLGR